MTTGGGPTDNAPLRYILRHGIVPWGIVVGIGAAVGAAVGLRHETAGATPISSTTIIVTAALCFVVWCLLAGWTVGAIRWQLRRRDDGTPFPRDRGPRQ